MDVQKVKVGLRWASAVLAIFVILYLPVIAYSPPLKDDGYYTADTPSAFIFSKMDENDILFYSYVNGSLSKEPTYVTTRIQSYENQFFHEGFEFRFVYHGTNDTSVMVKEMTISREPGPHHWHKMQKTINPFTLWHIKWLEWTNEH